MDRLWRERSGVLSRQVLREYYAVVTRKSGVALDRQIARQDVRDLSSWLPDKVSEAEPLEEAWMVQDRYGLSFFDSLIVASAQISGCGLLLTEDLQDGQRLGRLQVLNPFTSSPEETDFRPMGHG